MPVYVYGCSNKEHPTVEKTHGMQEEVIILCKVCGEQMHRIPQPFRWGFDAKMVLLDKIDREYNPANGTKRKVR